MTDLQEEEIVDFIDNMVKKKVEEAMAMQLTLPQPILITPETMKVIIDNLVVQLRRSYNRDGWEVMLIDNMTGYRKVIEAY